MFLYTKLNIKPFVPNQCIVQDIKRLDVISCFVVLNQRNTMTLLPFQGRSDVSDDLVKTASSPVCPVSYKILYPGN